MTDEGLEFMLLDLRHMLQNGKVDQAILMVDAALIHARTSQQLKTSVAMVLRSFPSTTFDEQAWRDKWQATPELQQVFNANCESSIVFRPQDQLAPDFIEAGQPFLKFVMVPE